jgi:CRISPR-associated endonuclease/helicase Cas3
LADGRFFWIDLAENEAKPYEYSEIAQSREILATIAQGNSQVGIEHLPNVVLNREDSSILRQRDLMELFDTTPDLAGQDIDISSYIRDGDERDVQVYWRHVDEDASDPGDEAPPRRQELCSVPVGSLKKCESKIRAWTQGFLDGEWKTLEKATAIPGQIWLIAADSGRYTTQTGWDETSALAVGVFTTISTVVERSTADDPYSMTENNWQTIAQHTDHVCSVLETIISVLSLSADDAQHLRQAARYHDLGKAHFAFQDKLKKETLALAPATMAGQYLAKAPQAAWARTGPRRYFRHELASALACLQWNLPNLVTYLVGAHHGKVRQSIRSLPNETEPKDERLFARGVHDGDVLPEVDLGGGITTSAAILSLEPMKIGASFEGTQSWVDRALDLRDTHGVFHLGYLEAILRAADHRASANKD